ncbi:hypothetical protein ATANTOWER_031200 [Ataeniobius toweri]|uniref:Uncharacterized protein n=1 Tax=Ataeniobius toweri TaxID=208326 RepID=A0ABU7AE19_9TELE|nr:hypothetical protein [Ataeniobius toweri]
MGANNSTRRVSFESDENDNITVVKGIRLSENVIKRMKEPTAPTSPTLKAPTLTPSSLPRPVPPLVDLATSLPSPLPFVEPVAPRAPSPPPKPPTEQVAGNTKVDLVLSHSSPSASANAVAASAFEALTPRSAPPPLAHTEQLTPVSCHTSGVVEAVTPLAPPPPVTEAPPPFTQSIACTPSVVTPPHAIEPLASPRVPILNSESLSSPPVFKPITILPASMHPSGGSVPQQPAEPLATYHLSEFTAACEPVAPPSQPTAESLSPAPVPEPAAVPQSSPVSPPAAPPAGEFHF